MNSENAMFEVQFKILYISIESHASSVPEIFVFSYILNHFIDFETFNVVMNSWSEVLKRTRYDLLNIECFFLMVHYFAMKIDQIIDIVMGNNIFWKYFALFGGLNSKSTTF